LGARIDDDPASLTRMPSEITGLAVGMWKRALKLAGEAAIHDDNAARERLRKLKLEKDIKQRSFELRERKIDAQARNANEHPPKHKTIFCRFRRLSRASRRPIRPMSDASPISTNACAIVK
jgi:hypothetical protein